MTTRAIGRLDFHLHSYASNVTDYYAANSLAIPESYSDPLQLYRVLKGRGMSLVTLTDHNSIDGVREMLDAGFEDVFISAEMTTTFPEDGCNIHVTVANMTEAQFAEIDRLRPNVYEMIAYVDEQIAAEAGDPDRNRLAYFMTHPLMSTQNRPYGREGSLGLQHIERALLLCNCFEVRNGTRTRSLNEFTVRLLESLDRHTIERLADKHDLEPKGEAPWSKAVVAGSDDHSGINTGCTWTEFTYPSGTRPTPNDLIASIRRHDTRPAGEHGGPVTLAHAMVKLLYDGNKQRDKASGSKGVTIDGPIGSLLRFVFDANSMKPHQKLGLALRAWIQSLSGGYDAQRAKSFEKIVAAEAHALLKDRQFRCALDAAERTDDRIFIVVSSLLNRIFSCYVQRITSAQSFDLVRVIKETVALVTSNVFVSLPYLISYFSQSSDRAIVRDVRKGFGLADTEKLVLVTDTFFEINGVSKSIRRMIEEAERRDIDFTVVTCLGEQEYDQRCRDPAIRALVNSGRLKIFRSILTFDLPEYDELQVRVPPFLELLKYLQETGFTKMQISTPGVIGIAGLLASKLLQLEVAATYHTSFPEYVENYTQDVSLEAFTWKYMILFYHSVDEVVVPSKFIAKQLHERGLRNRKLLILDRWADVERFDPAKRDERYWEQYGIERADEVVKFVYVGRVGVEKNLATLAEAYRRLATARDDTRLIIIGGGPYREELERALAGLPVTFTGFLEGEELARAVASADVKVFPSTTDTWGNAPLEAQAAGLPVIVSDKGGPQELMQHGVTGLRVPGRDANALHDAMVALLDPATRARMGSNARAFAVANRVDQPFTAILDSETYRAQARARKRAAAAQGERPDIRIHGPEVINEPTATEELETLVPVADL